MLRALLVAAALVAAAPAPHLVTMEGTAFAPQTVHVKVGDRITWKNTDPFPHTVTSRAGGFDSRSIEPGRTWTYRARRKGEFPYVCTLHPGMTGTLVVE